MRIKSLLTTFLFGVLLAFLAGHPSIPAHSQTTPDTPRVNAPYSDRETPPVSGHAVFWFGQVTSTTNYADTRIAYNDEALFVTVHIFDRYIWYDNAASDLTQWDAVALHMDLDGPTGNAPTGNSYRFVAQMNSSAAYHGNGSQWAPATLPFDTEAFWRGDGVNNGAEARGWSVTYRIPFSSLGLAGPPSASDVWGLAVAVYDRDQQSGPPGPTQFWPELATSTTPGTWGALRFGLPTYTPPGAAPGGTVTVRHGLNGATVQDAHVGGSSTCAEAINPDFFQLWGNLNYAGAEQINVQNQYDVADWPCFSKYYVTFPLNAVPNGKVILSATLTVYQFGNANPSQALDSNIQALTVAEGWDEGTITWNNAPAAVENVDTTRVSPIVDFPGWPGVPHTWDVSKSVAEAYAAGRPARLVLYSADGAYHSGKYFTSSDTEEWNAEGRPTLTIVWGEPEAPTPPPNLDFSNYMPIISALR